MNYPSIIRSFFKYLLIIAFCAFITSPAIKMISQDTVDLSKGEQRAISKWPDFPGNTEGLAQYFKRIDNYLNDHFGYRDHYIYRYKRELQKRFSKATINPRVIEGVDGWLFFDNFNLINDFLGLVPLTESELARWFELLQQKQKWLEARGIKYLFVVAPNKQSVYPNLVMDNGHLKKGTTRFEQLQQYVGYQLPGFMINLHAVLQPEKYEKPLYYKYDTHWNKYGAYIAFQQIMAKVSEWFPEEKFQTEFEFLADNTGVTGNTGHAGDLAKMIMQPELEETYPQLKEFRQCGAYNFNIPYQLSDIGFGEGMNSFIRTCPTKDLRALVFRDSFFVAVEPLISENFKEVIYLWKEFDQKNVEELLAFYKPDIVIEERAERHVFDSLLGIDWKKIQQKK